MGSRGSTFVEPSAPWATAVHKLSPKTRDVSEVVYLTVRNNLALAWKFFPVKRALALTLWRVPHYVFTRLSRGEVCCIRRVFSILAAVPGALGRRRPISRSTMRIMDALTLAPALSLDEMRRLRENPPRTSLAARLRARLGGSR